MGKKIVYESKPSGPRAAKIAWSRFAAIWGHAPHDMRFDSLTGEWVGCYDEADYRISAEDPAIGMEREF